jgi:hypothetical protein
MMREKRTGAELLGSWTCMIGDQDEAGMLIDMYMYIKYSLLAYYM